MMRSLTIVALVLSVSMIAGTCQKKEKAKTEMSQETVMCSKCQAVWVPVYGTGKFTGEVRGYTKEKGKEVCPDCKAAAQKHFADGSPMECKTCGECLQVCSQQSMK